MWNSDALNILGNIAILLLWWLLLLLGHAGGQGLFGAEVAHPPRACVGLLWLLWFPLTGADMGFRRRFQFSLNVSECERERLSVALMSCVGAVWHFINNLHQATLEPCCFQTTDCIQQNHKRKQCYWNVSVVILPQENTSKRSEETLQILIHPDPTGGSHLGAFTDCP